MRNETILLQARFDSKLQTYWMLTTLIMLAATIVGIPFVPAWLIVGWSFHRKHYERLQCELTTRSVNVRRGSLFRVEKHVPLDKIQDVSMREGPILRSLGLSALAIETAGQSGAHGGSDAVLVGVVDAPKFRDAILEQRDRVVLASDDAPVSAPRAGGDGDALLIEIRDSLRRIEGLIARETPPRG
jgi:putative membrane protein